MAAYSTALSFGGLEPLGDASVYEGWLIIDGAAYTTGTFNITPAGDVDTITSVSVADADRASLFVLTIEPAVDPDPAPAATHVLAGPFVDGSAQLSIDHPAALGDDFAGAGGSFIVATPTTATNDDALSGVWFLDPAAGPGPSLTVPTLPAGWAYEGWVVIDGTPVSTGRFTSASGADDFGGFSGPQPAPPFPGEDFVANAPAGLRFPTDLSGYPVVVSVEPSPDDSPAPFALKPLVGHVPATNAMPGTSYPFGAGPVALTGTGNDLLVAGNGGSDTVTGGSGDDKVAGGPRPDMVWGGDGNDEVKGNGGADRIYGGGGDDELAGGKQADVLDGGDGTDSCSGGTTGGGAPEGDSAVACESVVSVP